MFDIIQQIRDTYASNPAAALNMLPEPFKMHDDGLIPVLPCKVGTTIYAIAKCESVHVDRDDDYFTGTGAMECPFEDQCNFEDCNDTNEQIFETTVTDFWYGQQNGKSTEMFLEHLELTVTAKDFGKTVFLTRESAEKALKERESDG